MTVGRRRASFLVVALAAWVLGTSLGALHGTETVAAQSTGEIDHVIGELTRVRDMLRSEGERVQREISGYASLSQAAMTSMTIIADSMAQWKSQQPRTTQSNS